MENYPEWIPMRELIILKTGSTLPTLLARKGDFTDWIVAGLDAGSAAVRIVDAENGDALPAYDDVAGVVITGSHDMVTERQPWSEQAAAWLPGLVERGIPDPRHLLRPPVVGPRAGRRGRR